MSKSFWQKLREPRFAALVNLSVNALLAMIGVVLALGMLEIALRLFPRLIPADVPSYPPTRRFTPNQNVWSEIRRSNGDLFVRMQGKLQPIEPAEDRVLDRLHLVTDHLGFRNTEPWQDKYELVALGDSFTYGTAVPTPWPERLAQITGKPALNLGWEGIGPLEERDLFLQYGRTKSPHWVVIAYFEGNDLNDVRSYLQADPLLMPRVAKYYWKQFGLWTPAKTQSSPPPVAPSAAPEYLYPLDLPIQGKSIGTTFFDFYLSWLTARAPDLAASQNLRPVPESWKSIRRELNSEARLLIVYVPSKEHLLLPQVHESQTSSRIFANIPAIQLDSNRFLIQGSDLVSADQALAHIDDQEIAVERLARETGVDFLDLTPCFSHKLQQGAILYYEFDTHWNQAGHDLAAELIADYLARGKSSCR